VSIQKRFVKAPAPAVHIVGPRLVSPKDAAAYLSMSVDVVREMIQKRQIPYILNGRRYLLDRLDLDRYIEKIKIGAA
jgi:excisionase family DNA binding protein